MTSLLTLQNLVAWSVQVMLLAAAALLMIRVVRVDAPSVRYLFLRVLLAVCLALPLLQPLTSGQVETAGAVETSMSVAQAGSGTTTAEAAAGRWVEDPRWSRAIFLVLIGGALARLAWLSAGLVRLRRLRRTGSPVPADAVGEELQAAIGTRAGIRYVPDLGQPVTFGIRQPVVLLPESLRHKPEAIRRAVMVHELWHVRRRDWLWTVAEEALRAAFWFHPAIRALLSEIQLTREEVVDELTILATGSRRSYVEALLAYADEAPVFAAAAFARRRHLVRRMVLISKEAVMSAKRVVLSGAVLAVVLASTSLFVVQAFPLVQSVDDDLFGSPGPVEQRARPITPENPIPRRTHYVAPDYPAAANAAGLRGTVTVRLAVDESGAVAETRVVQITASLPGNKMASRVSSAASVAEWVRLASTVDPRVDPTAASAALKAILLEARRSVSQWRYAPPADGPIAFSVDVDFGPPGAAGRVLPPPPPPAPGQGSGLAANGAIRVGGNIPPPTKIRHVNPVYPEDAKAQKVQGVVIIEARIEEDGSVGDARIQRSIPLLDEAALDAVRQWEFKPTLLNGKPVPVIMTVTINFTLQD